MGWATQSQAESPLQCYSVTAIPFTLDLSSAVSPLLAFLIVEQLPDFIRLGCLQIALLTMLMR